MKFRSEHHDKKVGDIMNRELPNVKAPVPRPMRAHTFDFNLTFEGARLLDGKCKLTETQHEKAILVFHSLDQLAFKDKALALLTTSDSFTFYSSWIVDGAAYIQTCYHELRKFKIGPITKIDEDEDKNAEHLQVPPTFAINGNADFEKTDENILKVWGNLQSEIRGLIGVIFRAVDIMCEAISEMDINAISENRNTAYNSGWGEPKFTAGDISELKSSDVSRTRQSTSTAEKRWRVKILLTIKQGQISSCTRDSKRFGNQVSRCLQRCVQQSNLV